jgi:hypothetical protein
MSVLVSNRTAKFEAITYSIELHDMLIDFMQHGFGVKSVDDYVRLRYTLTKDGKVIKRINPKRVTTMRRKLKKLSVKVINGEIEYESIENMFRSWMGAHYKLLSKQQRKNLIQLYEELFNNKKISVISRKLIVSDASSLAA